MHPEAGAPTPAPNDAGLMDAADDAEETGRDGGETPDGGGPADGTPGPGETPTDEGEPSCAAGVQGQGAVHPLWLLLVLLVGRRRRKPTSRP